MRLATRFHIFEVLQYRFGKLPKTLMHRVKCVDGHDDISDLFTLTLKAKNLAEFEKGLGKSLGLPNGDARAEPGEEGEEDAD